MSYLRLWEESCYTVTDDVTVSKRFVETKLLYLRLQPHILCVHTLTQNIQHGSSLKTKQTKPECRINKTTKAIFSKHKNRNNSVIFTELKFGMVAAETDV